MKALVVLTVLLLLACAGPATGHGVQHSASQEGTAIRASYNDGSPMGFCDFAVFAPGEDLEYQTGITDRNGGFAFLPDTLGVWRVTVDDGMGHLVQADIEIGLQGLVSARGEMRSDGPSTAVVGVSVIFGLWGLWMMFARRPRHQKQQAGD